MLNFRLRTSCFLLCGLYCTTVVGAAYRLIRYTVGTRPPSNSCQFCGLAYRSRHRTVLNIRLINVYRWIRPIVQTSNRLKYSVVYFAVVYPGPYVSGPSIWIKAVGTMPSNMCRRLTWAVCIGAVYMDQSRWYYAVV